MFVTGIPRSLIGRVDIGGGVTLTPDSRRRIHLVNERTDIGQATMVLVGVSLGEIRIFRSEEFVVLGRRGNGLGGSGEEELMGGEAGALVGLKHIVGEPAIRGQLEIGSELGGGNGGVLGTRSSHAVHRAGRNSLLLLLSAALDARRDFTEFVHVSVVP